MIFESRHEKSKETKWQAIEHRVELTIDGLGKIVDAQIKFAVIALKANGFGTTGSCAGHDNRGLPYPWVEVESQIAEQLTSEQKYTERKEVVIKENEKTHQQLKKLLAEFYDQETGTAVPLIIKRGPWNQSRLQPEGVPTGKNWREQVASMDQEEKIKNLELYRQEMNRFADFLKRKFFDSK